MKKLLASVILAGVALPVWPVPYLQLDTDPGMYDPGTQTTVATANPFTLRALINPNAPDFGAGGLTRSYYISAAIVPEPSSPAFGSFTIDGNPYSSANMTYGVPPVELIVKKDLPDHGIYDTYFAEIEFSLNPANSIPSYNVQDGTSAPGSLYFVDFTVNVIGLQPTFSVHFDLYALGQDGKFKFAPFSHDAQSGHGIIIDVPPPVPDASSTVTLLGLALLGVAGLRFRFGAGRR